MNKFIEYIKKSKKALLLLPVFLVGLSANAETEGSSFSEMLATKEGMFIIMIGTFIVIVSLLMMAVLYLLVQVKNILFKKAGLTEAEKETAWDRFYVQYISGKHAPVGKEADKMMDHEYDGIREMDHTMPPWLRYVFIGTIVFAVYYLAVYFVFDLRDNQYEEYAQQLQEAELLAVQRQGDTPPITAETVARDNSAEAMANGKQIFNISCSPCHAKDGGGTIGPYLTDEYWIHGGSINNVFRIIKYGVKEKGMIPWQDKLSAEEIQGVSSYILTLQGTNPENPKAPQGEKY
jgi:cytochrome c oxidase cbb3-type subunit III